MYRIHRSSISPRSCGWSARALALASALITVPASVEAAESYPAKTVRFIVGPGPNSGTDIMARTIPQKLSERMGQSVIVDNRPGAGGTIAVATTAKAAPDGYTILFVSGSLVIHPSSTASYRTISSAIWRRSPSSASCRRFSSCTLRSRRRAFPSSSRLRKPARATSPTVRAGRAARAISPASCCRRWQASVSLTCHTKARARRP